MGLGISIGLDTLPRVGAGFTPATLPNLILWLDASVGITTETGVSKWEDQSGQDNHMTQTTDGYQPPYNSDVYGGLPGLNPDGIDDWMDFTSNPTLSDYSIIAVVDSLGYVAGSDASSVHYINHNTASTTIRHSEILGFSFSNDPLGWVMIEFYRTGSSVTCFKNGAASADNPKTGSTASLLRTLFRRTTTYSPVPDLGEFIICTSELSASNKTALRTHLSTKYAITLP